MKIFGSARLKLTATYTIILMAISIAFSIVIALTASQEIGRAPRILDRNIDNVVMEKIIKERDEHTNSRIFTSLVFVNMIVLLVGLAGSYFLAQWTLRPIEKAMENQARFVSDASHELRTPLAAISLENEVIIRDKNSTAKDLRRQIRSNLDEISKLRDLTNYLLELNEEAAADFNDANVADIVSSAVATNSKLAKAKNVVIDNEVRPETIKTDSSALTEIVSIFINNAIKYSPENSEIKVINRDNCIMVIDQGDGISEADMPRIFDRFYRTEKSRTSEGYGLGLSLARHLAEKIGASITVSNNNGKGATFTVRL